MDNIKSIFNYPKKDITEKDPGLYRFGRKAYVKDDVKVLNDLLKRLLKKSSDVRHLKKENNPFGSGYTKYFDSKQNKNQPVS